MPGISIYVSHGTLIELKVLAREYQGPQVIALYDPREQTFNVIKEDKTIDQYELDQFIELCQKDSPITRLCCDANLGKSFQDLGDEVSELAKKLVEDLSPQHLLFFSDTPQCRDDAKNNYFKTLTTSSVRDAVVVERKNLREVINGTIGPDYQSESSTKLYRNALSEMRQEQQPPSPAASEDIETKPDL